MPSKAWLLVILLRSASSQPAISTAVIALESAAISGFTLSSAACLCSAIVCAEHPVRVAGHQVIDVEAFTEEHLTAEAALLAFRDEDLIAFDRGPRALCLHCHHVLFHGQLDRVRIDPGEVRIRQRSGRP